MVFNSLSFAAFFVLLLLITQSLPTAGGRKLVLLLASYVFYAAWNPPFVALIWLSTCVDWFAAKRIEKASIVSRRKAWLLLSLFSNLGLLTAFKYGDFLLDNLNALLSYFDLSFRSTDLDLILPVGISFYTFQTLSYTIDVYRGTLKPSSKFLDFALFVTFFPQLVAGPIVRASNFLPQCRFATKATVDQLGWGLCLLTLGLFQKTVLSDALLSSIVEPVYWSGAQPNTIDAWAGTLAFAMQIFCDFAGYSTAAIGVAMCFGFELSQNFRFPYAAIGFSDFWRRWHISLSTWLRDYLYISLGGNRGSLARILRNLMITMLLGGLWHGTAWTFVIWGALHGVYLVIERGVRSLLSFETRQSFRWVGWALTLYGVLVAWVFFRANSMSDAFHILSAMHGDSSAPSLLTPLNITKTFVMTAFVVGVHLYMRQRELREFVQGLSRPILIVSLVSMWASIVGFGGADRAFIYFQF